MHLLVSEQYIDSIMHGATIEVLSLLSSFICRSPCFCCIFIFEIEAQISKEFQMLIFYLLFGKPSEQMAVHLPAFHLGIILKFVSGTVNVSTACASDRNSEIVFAQLLC